ncbi:MAG: mandelate racemase/muconate lactonizing enzyme family protein [Nitrospinota bacterium]|nr:MAG: mandelate racemase/muconate lactonizing enzyme family protein [Nitrospinota bacterium]
MQIRRIEAQALQVPVTAPLLDRPIRRGVVFVEIETDTGITGYGLTSYALHSAIREFINTEAAPFLQGQDPLCTERIWHQMFWSFNQRAQTGAWCSAMSAIDIALWDIKGKILGQPVWRLLGGAQNPVPAYITFGLPEYDQDQLVEAAKMWVGQGQDKLKMVVAVRGYKEGKVTGPADGPEEDARRVQAVREAIGEGIELMIDANYLFPYHHALRLCKLCEPYHITWFEEPLYQNDALLLAQLRRQTTVPIAAGQNEGHRFRHRELLIHQAVDFLQPNVVHGGGYTECAKVAGMAQAFNIPIANGGGWPHHNMHLQAGMANGTRVEFHYIMWKVGEILFQNPPAPVQGWVTLPETPGLGLEPNPDALKEYQVP